MSFVTIGLIWIVMASVSIGLKIYFRNHNLFAVRQGDDE